MHTLCDQHSIQPKDYYAILALYTMQHAENELFQPILISKRLKETRGISLLRMQRLELSGYVDKLGICWNVSEKGEYLVRAYVIEMNRILNDSELSKWSKAKALDPALSKALRPPNKKGVKKY